MAFFFIPAASSSSKTRVIFVALPNIASRAVLPWVTTPADTVAMSGAILAVPVAET